MKNLLLFISLLLAATISLNAQCPEITIEEAGKKLASQPFNLTQAESNSEIILNLTASAKNTSWATKNAESAVLTVFLDGKYQQDIILFYGAEKFNYKALLGKLNAGKHKLEIVLNRKRTAKKSGEVSISSVKIKPYLAKTPADQLAISHTPFLYVRPDTIDRFSDIPTLTFYEILPIKENSYLIRYTTIFSNEDGGTQTAALMARWGRTTDIEWVYEIEIENGKVVSEKFQGANHVTKNFSGSRLFGNHPALYDVTVNNNFADTGCSALRAAQIPIRADLTAKSRETLMDENPWIYRIMAEEAIREGRINPEKLGANTIADLRDYVYAEIHNEPQESAISLEAKTSDGKTYSSDGDNKFLRVDRKGFIRIALLLPRNARRNSSLTFSIVCYSKDVNNQTGGCQKTNLLKIVTLGEDFSPQETKIKTNPFSLRLNERATFTAKLP